MTDPRLPIEEILDRPEGAPPAGRILGRSREGREIVGYRLGSGPLQVSLIAGCHADEPVGPALLAKLVAHLNERPPDAPELAAATWSIVPHANPDGRARNAPWQGETVPVAPTPRARPDAAARGYDLARYLRHVVREAPGDDIEFGFPRGLGDSGARPENQAVAAFLRPAAPFHLHATLHGMAFAAGPWFLLEPAWVDRTAALRSALAARVAELGYRLYDIDRRGEKGFRRVAEGFSTRPDSGAMMEHFRQHGDLATARLFRPSSMEMVRALGGDPLTLVSEMPLFVVEPSAEPQAGQAAGFPERPPLPVDAAGRQRFSAWLDRLAGCGPAEEIRRRAEAAGIRPMPLRDQMRLQLAFLDQGLAAVHAA